LADRARDAFGSDRRVASPSVVRGGVNRNRPTEGPKLAQTGVVVEVHVCDENCIRERDIPIEQLASDIGARIDEQRSSGSVVLDVNRKPGSFDTVGACVRTRATVTAEHRQSLRRSGPENRDLHVDPVRSVSA